MRDLWRWGVREEKEEGGKEEEVGRKRTITPSVPPSTPSPLLCLLSDIRLRPTITTVLETSLAHWTRIDIIANCITHAVMGACEDQDEAEIRNQFEIGFWGTLNIVQLSLGYFRRERGDDDDDDEGGEGGGEGGEGGKGGRYLIYSPIHGSLGVPGLGPSTATKYALEGLLESLIHEHPPSSASFKITLLEPGPLSPSSSSSSLPSPSSSLLTTTIPPSAPYSTPTAPSSHAQRMQRWIRGREGTSLAKVAETVWKVGRAREPPFRLLLGGFGVECGRERVRGLGEEIGEGGRVRGLGEEIGEGGRV